jgi:hypothetical protein
VLADLLIEDDEAQPAAPIQRVAQPVPAPDVRVAP